MKRSTVVATLGLMAAFALADDGWVGNSGSPTILHGKHSSIRMADEVVRIHVGDNFTKVDCVFHFINEGPATTVRMGFPDVDSQRESTSGSVFRKFRSWVDGKRVKCKFTGSFSDGFWQVKQVHFGAGQRRTVRDAYTVYTGSGDEGAATYLHYANYILGTGNSWQGSIGDVRVAVDFDSSFFRPKKLMTKAEQNKVAHPDEDLDKEVLSRIRRFYESNANTIFWSGPCQPTLTGQTLVFVAKDLRPTRDDNISLTFKPFHPFQSH